MPSLHGNPAKLPDAGGSGAAGAEGAPSGSEAPPTTESPGPVPSDHLTPPLGSPMVSVSPSASKQRRSEGSGRSPVPSPGRSIFSGPLTPARMRATVGGSKPKAPGDIAMANGTVMSRDNLKALVARPPVDHKWVFMPYSGGRRAWDVALLLVVVYTLMVTPVRIAFNWDAAEDPQGVLVFELVTDFFFIVDLAVNFNTAVEISDRVITDRRKIARAYAHSWLWLDMLSAVPVDFVLWLTVDRDPQVKALVASVSALRLVRLLRLVKILRMLKMLAIFQNIEESSFFSAGFSSVVQMLLGVLFLSHLIACAWWAAGTLLEERYAGWMDTWNFPAIEGEDLMQLPTSRAYLYSLYWSLTTLSTVGYGDITPTTDMEVGFACFGMLFGATAFAYMTGTMASMVQSYNYAAMLRRQKIQQLTSYLHKAKVPAELARRVKTYMQRHLDHNTLNDDQVLGGLPARLRAELRLSAVVQHALRIPLFEALRSKGASLEKLGAFFEIRTFVPDEFVVRAGESLGEAFFVTYGTLRVVRDNTARVEVTRLTSPDVFGEPFARGAEAKYDYAVLAVRWADCLVLGATAFIKLYAEHPDWAQAIKVATGVRAVDLNAELEEHRARKAAAAEERRQRAERYLPKRSRNGTLRTLVSIDSHDAASKGCSRATSAEAGTGPRGALIRYFSRSAGPAGAGGGANTAGNRVQPVSASVSGNPAPGAKASGRAALAPSDADAGGGAPLGAPGAGSLLADIDAPGSSWACPDNAGQRGRVARSPGKAGFEGGCSGKGGAAPTHTGPETATGIARLDDVDEGSGVIQRRPSMAERIHGWMNASDDKVTALDPGQAATGNAGGDAADAARNPAATADHDPVEAALAELRRRRAARLFVKRLRNAADIGDGDGTNSAPDLVVRFSDMPQTQQLQVMHDRLEALQTGMEELKAALLPERSERMSTAGPVCSDPDSGGGRPGDTIEDVRESAGGGAAGSIQPLCLARSVSAGPLAGDTQPAAVSRQSSRWRGAGGVSTPPPPSGPAPGEASSAGWKYAGPSR
mmetsp:Transcript_15010/g.44043  ORF Transcript_15010/g.44043 Transcript_15010/m.44043 type:complete len:1039 (+) Transcript_15010:96-3212(+)